MRGCTCVFVEGECVSVPSALSSPETVRGEAEEFYAGHGATARFQISPSAGPEGLDTVLAERGYRRQSPVSLQVASTARVLQQVPTTSLRVRLDDRPTRLPLPHRRLKPASVSGHP